MLKTAVFALGACAMAALTAPAASAQLSRDGGPIEINADRGVLEDANSRAVYQGNVDVIQGDARLRAQTVTISYMPREAGEQGGLGGSIGGLKTIEAVGDVYYITDREKMKASRGVYDAQSETITLTGEVKVTNADGVIVGEKLVIDINSGRYTMDGGGQGGRITTVLDTTSDEPIQ